MKVEYINPFLESMKNILEQFGVKDIKRGKIQKKENMNVNLNITSVIGVVGEIRGNISYSFSKDTAKKIASTMMMGMPVETLDDMARSAIGELANMITGNAATMLASKEISFDITPPSIIFGENIYMIISSVGALAIDIETDVGNIEVNIGLEI